MTGVSVNGYIAALKTIARSVVLAAAVAVAPAWLLVAAGPVAAQVSALKNHDTAQPLDITADRLEVREKEDIAVFTGSVEAVQGDLRISADSVTVHYRKPEGGGDPTILRLDMAGHAKLVSPSEEVASEWAIYDVEARLLTLGGSVVLARGETLLRGERLELDLKSGVTKFEGAPVAGEGQQSGRVRGRFSVPGDREEADSGEENSQAEDKKN